MHLFLTPTLSGGGKLASWPNHFTPCERVPGTIDRGGLVCPTTSLKVLEKIKIFVPASYQTKIPWSSSLQANYYTDYATKSQRSTVQKTSQTGHSLSGFLLK